MGDRIYRAQLVLDTGLMQQGAAAADRALAAVGATTDALAQHLALAAAAGSRFEAQQASQAQVGQRAAAAAQAQAQALRTAATGQAAVLGAPAEQASQAALASIRNLAQVGRISKLTAFELQQVAFQVNDLAVQVASGQSPLIALVQQGSQLSGTFGGVRPAFSALLSLLTPLRVAVGGVAAGVGTLALAYAEGYAEVTRFDNSLIASGNRAGITRGQYESIAATVANTARVTIGASREIVQALVSTGQVGAQAIAPLAETGALLQSKLGKGVEEVTPLLVRLASEPTRAAAELSRTYNFLTTDVYKHVRALELQGKAGEAAAVASKALNDRLKEIQPELGGLEKGWIALKQAASSTWDTMLGIGRPASIGDEIKTVSIALAEAERTLAVARSKGAANAPQVAEKEAAVERFRATLESRGIL